MGRHSDLTEALTLEIRKRVLAGQQYKEIQSELDIPDGTWDGWVYRDIQGFRKSLLDWKAERFLRMAEDNMPFLLNSENEKVKADMSKFVMETVGKERYAKRTEQTGKDGGPIEQSFKLTDLLKKVDG